MNTLDFDVIVEGQCEACKEVLVLKGKEYSTNENRLLNFKQGAEYLRCHPATVCLSYLTKHLVSVRDIVDAVEHGVIPPQEMLDEKITDSINYLILLKAILLDDRK